MLEGGSIQSVRLFTEIMKNLGPDGRYYFQAGAIIVPGAVSILNSRRAIMLMHRIRILADGGQARASSGRDSHSWRCTAV